jgi:uncharacterized protein YbjT (DUF2867 family)
MSVLVMGSSGRIGSLVSDALAADGTEVMRATRSPSNPNDARFDWRDETTWAVAEGAESVFLMTPEQAGPLGLEGSKFVSRAVDAGVRRIVLLSAFGVDAMPDVTGMQAIEAAVHRSGLEWSILRPNTFMQNFIHGPFASAINQGLIVAPVGDAAVSFIDFGDIARCAVAELGPNATGGVLTLTGPTVVTFAEAAAMISEASGRPVKYRDPGEDGQRQILGEIGMPPPIAEMILGFYATLRSGAHAVVTDTVEQLTSEAPTTFASFCAVHANEWALR